MLVVVGDSNTICLTQGLSKLNASSKQVLTSNFDQIIVGGIMRGFDPFRDFFELTNQGLQFIKFPEAWRFEKLTGSKFIVSHDSRAFGFCFGLHSISLARESVWQQYGISTRCQKMFLSSAVFREIVLYQNRFALKFVDSCQQLRLRFFMISAPPIQDKFIEKYKLAMSRIEHVEFQKTYREIMQAEMDLRGIPVVRSPRGSDCDGILLPQYELEHSEDDSHANDRYGACFWEQFATRLADDPEFVAAVGTTN